MELLIIAGVDISHVRLVDLTRLADQARPFYDWIENQFQTVLNIPDTLERIIQTANAEDIKRGIAACYNPAEDTDLPFLFDGIGRTYTHSKACYYFFSWLIRDAPQQRLAPLVQRIVRNAHQSRVEVEIEVLAALIVRYRANVKTFSWDVIREIIIDRLEGSRRSIRGREKEIVVRTALLVAIQDYFEKHKNYGVFAGVEISDSQIMIGNESYDVSVKLLDQAGEVQARILMPIKTRETEGGGHAHLFTRDIRSAINAVRTTQANDYLAVVIVAKNWSRREADNLANIVDYLVLFDLSPGEFTTFDNASQISLNNFIVNVFDGVVKPKALRDE